LAVAAKKRRVDPEPEHPSHFDEDIGQVLNKDPNRHYVWAYKVGPAIGNYENLGYDIELHRPDGPRSMTQRKTKAADTPVEWNDCVLMSCLLSEKEERDAAGQRKTDLMERSVISQDGPADPSRGIHRFQRGRTAVGLMNTTSEAQPDTDI
jgi:hypothetical protein